jgi:Spy/CpxP family protein refolding chaperone
MRVNILVERILADHEQARNSDKYLQLVVWHKMGLVLTPEQRAKFMDMPSAETIRRIRQKLQEHGKYKAADKISNERQWKALVMQQNVPTASSERVEGILRK